MSHTPTEAEPKAKSENLLPTESGRPAKKGSRWVLWTCLAAVVLGLGLIAYRSRVGKSGMGPGAGGRSRGGFNMNAPLPVVTRTARKADLNVILNGLGSVTPLATVTVRTQISGQLVQVNFKEGQMVNQGDVLAIIDPRPYQAALEQAQGQLLQAQAQLKEAQIDLERYQKLAEQDSISKQQVDAQSALVQQYEGVAKTDQAAVDNASLNLAYCHITAPCSGRVGLRLVDQGNYVTPGDATGLVILTQLRPITVIFSLAEDYIPAVQKRIASGDPIKVDVYNRTDSVKLASGTLTTIDNTVDTTTGQFKLRATFANDDESLFPSQFVTVHMLLETEKGVVVVPTSGVERGQQGTFVYVVGEDSRVSAKTVVLGETEGERVEVKSGLAAGEKVVVDGADRLKEGMQVILDTSTPRKPGQAGSGSGHGGSGWGSQGGSGWGSQGGGQKPAKPAGSN